jgi:hypothetical protein
MAENSAALKRHQRDEDMIVIKHHFGDRNGVQWESDCLPCARY